MAIFGVSKVLYEWRFACPRLYILNYVQWMSKEMRQAISKLKESLQFHCVNEITVIFSILKLSVSFLYSVTVHNSKYTGSPNSWWFFWIWYFKYLGSSCIPFWWYKFLQTCGHLIICNKTFTSNIPRVRTMKTVLL